MQKVEVEKYKESVELLRSEMKQTEEFAEGKNAEIEEMMPPEFDRFTVETKNFFAD